MKQNKSLCSNKLLPPLPVLTLCFVFLNVLDAGCRPMWVWGAFPASVDYSMRTDLILWPKKNKKNTGHRPLRSGQKTEGCGGVAMDRRKVCIFMVLWAMVHLSSPGQGLRALRRTTGGRRGSGLTGQDANGVPLRRSKRGWMWNQFFLLEEYTGSDLQYVGKVVQGLTFFSFPSSDAADTLHYKQMQTTAALLYRNLLLMKHTSFMSWLKMSPHPTIHSRTSITHRLNKTTCDKKTKQWLGFFPALSRHQF